MPTATLDAPPKLDIEAVAAAVPKMLPMAGPSFYTITYGCAITDSGNQMQRVFQESHIWVGNVDVTKYQLFLSSQPYIPAPFIVDDGIFVNGHLHGGFMGVTGDPKQHLHDLPAVCYKAVDPIDVTTEIRRDGWLHLQLVDWGGYVYCASPLYLVVHTR